MVTSFRETGQGESARPTPYGEFDGITRVEAVRRMYDAVKAERRKRLLKRLRRPFLERVGKALAHATLAGIIWTGPKLTPQEAADVLRPHQTIVPCECFHGPYVASTGSEVEQLGADYRAAILRRATSEVAGIPAYRVRVPGLHGTRAPWPGSNVPRLNPRRY